MKSFFKKLGASLLEMVTSKKAIAAVAGAVVQALPIDDNTKVHIQGMIAAYILGQGVADAGKAKAQVEAAKPDSAMTNKQRIEELERRVRELEARPVVYPAIILLPPPPATVPQPYYPPWQPWAPSPLPFAEPFWMVPPPGTPGTFTC